MRRGAGVISPCRLSLFRTVGRLAGLALFNGMLFPLNLNRHVYKFLLGRRVRSSAYLSEGVRHRLPGSPLLTHDFVSDRVARPRLF